MARKRPDGIASRETGRPMPPASVADELLGLIFAPAPELGAWVRAIFIDPAGALANTEHAHLQDASLGFLWASSGYVSKGRRVIGTAEDTSMAGMGSPWKRARVEQQLREWFGDPPRFLITVDAFFWRECGDAEACALVEHELYHCAHLLDEFGAPAYTKDGQPRLGIVGHDVEEFVGVVRRYGIGDADSSLARLVIAAANGPRVEKARITHACGACLARV
jgi:Putative phage metallopeptidase